MYFVPIVENLLLHTLKKELCITNVILSVVVKIIMEKDFIMNTQNYYILILFQNKLKPVFSTVLKDLFNEWNTTSTNQQKQFKTRITEIDNKINTAKVKFGCGEIDKDIYDTVLKEFEPQRQDLQEKLDIAQINLSNYSAYVEYALSMSCKLGSLWNDCDITKRGKLQDLVFPDGVFYDKKTGTYRTPKHNSFFHAIKSETVNYKKEKGDKKKKFPICPLECG